MSVAVWRTKKLDELGTVGRGKSKHRPRDDRRLYDGPYPFFQTGDVKAANFYLTQYTQTYSEFGLAQSKLWPAGTLCVTIAANIGDSAILGIPGCFPDSVVGFVAGETLSDVRFVKYSIDVFKSRMQGISGGATQDNLSLDKLLSFDFPVPPLPIQRRIASILSAYDDLIENHRKRIAILEEMARRLYREWFVHFRYPGHEAVPLVDSPLGPIPQGWHWSSLRDIAGVNLRQLSPAAAPKTIRYIDIASVSSGSIDTITVMPFSEAPGRARRLVLNGDILWSCVRPNRRSHAIVLDPDPDTIASTGFAVISAKAVPWTFLYQTTTTDSFVGFLVGRAQGATYPAVRAEDFEVADILVPANDLLSRFHSQADVWAQLAANLRRQISVLRRTRDLLLPRLMSGTLSVDALATAEAAVP